MPLVPAKDLGIGCGGVGVGGWRGVGVCGCGVAVGLGATAKEVKTPLFRRQWHGWARQGPAIRNGDGRTKSRGGSSATVTSECHIRGARCTRVSLGL